MSFKHKDLLLFLKKYSDINISYIRDFLRIRNGNKLYYPFKINLDIVARWLDTKKGRIKKTLVEAYIENIDYISLLPRRKRTTRGGQNREIILLTEDCFKMLCMRSKTAKADEIRYYYVTLEKLVEIFKDDIIQNQQNKIEKLENNLRKIKYPVKGTIYVLAIEDGHKLGKTKNMNDRMDTYNTGHKDNPRVEFIFYTNDIDRVENCIKNLLMDYAYRGKKEFYLVDLKVIIEAIKMCGSMVDKFHCNKCNKGNKMTLPLNKLDEHKHVSGKTSKVNAYKLIKHRDAKKLPNYLQYKNKMRGGDPVLFSKIY